MRCHYPDLLEAENEEIAMIDEESERHEIEALLPWYAAGTLSRREADLIEQALAGDSELARRYDVVRQELTETIQLNETLGAPSARATEKLFAAIDAEEAPAPRKRLRRTSRTATASTMNNDAPSAQRS
jgi:anti-sigma-K factor RskA